MLIIDRKNFIAWTEGILLDRDEHGRVCVVGDNEIHERAVAAMDAGETIGLTVGGKIVTSMRLTDGGYEEEIA